MIFGRKRPIWSDAVLALARLSWRPEFWKTQENPNAPGGKVDMYLIVDDETGAGIVSVGCPVGRPDIPAYIADCCTNPWMMKPAPEEAFVELATLFNRAIHKHFKKDGMVDAKDVTLAAMAVIDSYLTDVPARARVDLVNTISAQLSRLRGEAIFDQSGGAT